MLDFSALESHVYRTIRQQKLILPGETVLAAVSGGSDSMALLTLLEALREEMPFHLEAAHFEHGIRGESSLEDMRFVREVCRARGIPCHTGAEDVPNLAARAKCSLEDAARRARYAFLDETAARRGAQKIALAHQMEDQAETVLLHLLHGSGVTGLSGMRARQGNRVRPLLDVRRDELRAYLLQKGVPWREDETNAEPVCTRNLLRLEVMPLLRRVNPRADEAVCRAAALCAQAADEALARAETLLQGRFCQTPYGAFWQAPSADAETARLFARKAGAPPLDEAQTRRLCALLPGEETDLAGGWRAMRGARGLHLLARKARYEAGNAPFACEPCATDARGDGVKCQVFDADRLQGAAFRARRDGDMFAPLGMAGAQKLKKTLQDAKVDRPFRDLLPVLARGESVLWIVGLRPSREAAVTEGTRRAVRIRYLGRLPWELDGAGLECETQEKIRWGKDYD